MFVRKVFPLGSLFSLVVVGLQADAVGETAAQDHAVVQSLLRIPDAKLAAYPWQKDAVLRHLGRIHEPSPADYVKITRQLDVRDQPQRLIQILALPEARQAGIDAAGLLMQFGKQQMLQAAVDDADDRRAAAAATLIGFVGAEETAQMLKTVMQDESRHLSVRSAAASGLGHSWFGEQILLKLARQDQVPSDVRFEVSNALLGSWSKETAEEAKTLSSLVPAAAAESEPIPPINKLLQMRGDGKQGKIVFDTIGTCAKCHQVLGEGKEVGPDLSEIGSKLSREDIYVNILNPSARSVTTLKRTPC